MNNQPRLVRPMLTDLNLDELHYYPFAISVNRGNGSCNTIRDPFGKICVPNKMEDVNLMNQNESKALAKYISCECRCEFDGRKCNLRQKWNNDKCQCECKKPIKHRACDGDYAWNPGTCACRCNKDCDIAKYLKDYECMKSLVDDLVGKCDAIQDTAKNVVINPIDGLHLLAY